MRVILPDKWRHLMDGARTEEAVRFQRALLEMRAAAGGEIVVLDERAVEIWDSRKP